MTRFRPCIDLHQGKVKQIVGGTLRDKDTSTKVNFESTRSAAWYARKYRKDNLKGGHVIMLGPGNANQARQALAEWPGGLQVGGGIGPDNAADWLDAGASHVILTSALFNSKGRFLENVASTIAAKIGRNRLVFDLSCRRETNGSARVTMNRWQTPTELPLNHHTLDRLAPHCAEFLIHAADVEGLCGGIDEELVTMLGNWGNLPITYAGGARSLDDLHHVDNLSAGNVDLTIGSALDLFGGSLVRYEDCVAFNRRKNAAE